MYPADVLRLVWIGFWIRVIVRGKKTSSIVEPGARTSFLAPFHLCTVAVVWK